MTVQLPCAMSKGCDAMQVLTVFFASFIAGSFLNQIQQFASAPATILSVLGTAAPQTATFFMSYLLLLGFTTKPLLFLRLTGALPACRGAGCTCYALASVLIGEVTLSAVHLYSIPRNHAMSCINTWVACMHANRLR